MAQTDKQYLDLEGLKTLTSCIHGDINGLSQELSQQISSLSTKINIEINRLSSNIGGVTSSISGVKSDLSRLSSNVDILEVELTSNMNGLKTELKSDINELQDIKTGESYYDIENQYIYYFKNMQDKVNWHINNNDINSDLIKSKQYIHPLIKTSLGDTSISIEGNNGDQIISLPTATYSSAGVMAADDKYRLDKLYDSIDDKQESMKIETILTHNPGTEYIIKKNTVLKIDPDINDELIISFDEPTYNDHGKFIQYGLYFSVGSNVPTISLPGNINWSNDIPIINYLETKRTYEIIFTTCDNGGSYTAVTANYERIDNIDNKPYFTMEFVTGGPVYIYRHGTAPSTGTLGEVYNYSIYNDSTKSWGDWQTLSVTPSSSTSLNFFKNFNSGQKVRWRGYGSINMQNLNNSSSTVSKMGSTEDYTYTNGDRCYSFGFDANINVKLSGNILSLFYGADFLNKNDVDLPAGAFQQLFKAGLKKDADVDNTTTIDASDLILPSKQLSLGAYYRMFYRCINLKNAPKILAEVAGDFCCKEMFLGCSSLTNAPELKFNDFGKTIQACSGMFHGCTSLNSPVIPPATKLSCGTYRRMFYKCTGLTTIPDIPANEVASEGNIPYNTSMFQMFYECTGVTKINGSLKIKTPGYNCYNGMFYGCTNLKIAPEIMATQISYKMCYQMFCNCTSLIAPPPYLPKNIIPATGYSGSYAFYEMFRGCESMKYGPILPAETPQEYMYHKMFYDCKSLKNIPFIGLHKMVSSNSTGCCDNMFYGCSTLKQVELTKNIDASGIILSTTIPPVISKIFYGADNLKSIRLCYDLDDKNSSETYDYLSKFLGLDNLTGNGNSKWYYTSTMNTPKKGYLHIPNSLYTKLSSSVTELKRKLVPDEWVMVVE